MSTPENAPRGTRAAGKRLWESVLSEYELEEHERALLVEAVRTVDLLTDLEAMVSAEGSVIDSPQGRKAHPAVVEARQQRIALARLLAALRLPAGDEDDKQSNARRPQRRSGARGIYGIAGGAS